MLAAGAVGKCLLRLQRDLSQYYSSSSTSTATTKTGSLDALEKHGFYEAEGEVYYLEDTSVKASEQKHCISVGDSLPYGPRMSYDVSDNVVRMKDIGEGNRILVLGVIGSFTPDCWNRHLFRVLWKIQYFEEREIDYICCISTNDAFVQKAWGMYLGCDERVLMWSDYSGRYTKALGMDIVIPWLDNTVRSRRYLIFAEDMVVTKMIAAPQDTPNMRWECEHLKEMELENVDSDDSW